MKPCEAKTQLRRVIRSQNANVERRTTTRKTRSCHAFPLLSSLSSLNHRLTLVLSQMLSSCLFFVVLLLVTTFIMISGIDVNRDAARSSTHFSGLNTVAHALELPLELSNTFGFPLPSSSSSPSSSSATGRSSIEEGLGGPARLSLLQLPPHLSYSELSIGGGIGLSTMPSLSNAHQPATMTPLTRQPYHLLFDVLTLRPIPTTSSPQSQGGSNSNKNNPNAMVGGAGGLVTPLNYMNTIKIIVPSPPTTTKDGSAEQQGKGFESLTFAPAGTSFPLNFHKYSIDPPAFDADNEGNRVSSGGVSSGHFLNNLNTPRGAAGWKYAEDIINAGEPAAAQIINSRNGGINFTAVPPPRPTACDNKNTPPSSCSSATNPPLPIDALFFRLAKRPLTFEELALVEAAAAEYNLTSTSSSTSSTRGLDWKTNPLLLLASIKNRNGVTKRIRNPFAKHNGIDAPFTLDASDDMWGATVVQQQQALSASAGSDAAYAYYKYGDNVIGTGGGEYSLASVFGGRTETGGGAEQEDQPLSSLYSDEFGFLSALIAMKRQQKTSLSSGGVGSSTGSSSTSLPNPSAAPPNHLFSLSSGVAPILYEASLRGGLYCSFQFRNLVRLATNGNPYDLVGSGSSSSSSSQSHDSELEPLLATIAEKGLAELDICLPRIASRWRLLNEMLYGIGADDNSKSSPSSPSSPPPPPLIHLSKRVTSMLFDPTGGLIDPLVCPIMSVGGGDVSENNDRGVVVGGDDAIDFDGSKFHGNSNSMKQYKKNRNAFTSFFSKPLYETVSSTTSASLPSFEAYLEDLPIFSTAAKAADRFNQTVSKSFPLAVGWHLGRYLTNSVLLQEEKGYMYDNGKLMRRRGRRKAAAAAAAATSSSSSSEASAPLLFPALPPYRYYRDGHHPTSASASYYVKAKKFFAPHFSSSSSTSSQQTKDDTIATNRHEPRFTLVDASNALVDAAQCFLITMSVCLMALEDAPFFQQGSLILFNSSGRVLGGRDPSMTVGVTEADFLNKFSGSGGSAPGAEDSTTSYSPRLSRPLTFNVSLPNAAAYPYWFTRPADNKSTSLAGFYSYQNTTVGVGRWVTTVTTTPADHFKSRRMELFAALTNAELPRLMQKMDGIIGRVVAVFKEVLEGLAGAEEVLNSMLMDMSSEAFDDEHLLSNEEEQEDEGTAGLSTSLQFNGAETILSSPIERFESLFAPIVFDKPVEDEDDITSVDDDGICSEEKGSDSPSSLSSSSVKRIIEARRIANALLPQTPHFRIKRVNRTTVVTRIINNSRVNPDGNGEGKYSTVIANETHARPSSLQQRPQQQNTQQQGILSQQSGEAPPPFGVRPSPHEIAIAIATLRATQRSLYCVRSFVLSIRNFTTLSDDHYLHAWSEYRRGVRVQRETTLTRDELNASKSSAATGYAIKKETRTTRSRHYKQRKIGRRSNNNENNNSSTAFGDEPSAFASFLYDGSLNDCFESGEDIVEPPMHVTPLDLVKQVVETGGSSSSSASSSSLPIFPTREEIALMRLPSVSEDKFSPLSTAPYTSSQRSSNITTRKNVYSRGVWGTLLDFANDGIRTSINRSLSLNPFEASPSIPTTFSQVDPSSSSSSSSSPRVLVPSNIIKASFSQQAQLDAKALVSVIRRDYIHHLILHQTQRHTFLTRMQRQEERRSLTITLDLRPRLPSSYSGVNLNLTSAVSSTDSPAARYQKLIAANDTKGLSAFFSNIIESIVLGNNDNRNYYGGQNQAVTPLYRVGIIRNDDDLSAVRALTTGGTEEGRHSNDDPSSFSSFCNPTPSEMVFVDWAFDWQGAEVGAAAGGSAVKRRPIVDGYAQGLSSLSSPSRLVDGYDDGHSVSPSSMPSSFTAFTAPIVLSTKIDVVVGSSSSSAPVVEKRTVSSAVLPPTFSTRHGDFQRAMSILNTMPMVVLPLYAYPLTYVASSTTTEKDGNVSVEPLVGLPFATEPATHRAEFKTVDGSSSHLSSSHHLSAMALPKHRGTPNSVGVPLPLLKDPSEGTPNAPQPSTRAPMMMPTSTAATTANPPPSSPTPTEVPYFGASIPPPSYVSNPSLAGGVDGAEVVCPEKGWRRTINPKTGLLECTHCVNRFPDFKFCAAREDAQRSCDNKALSNSDSVEEWVIRRGFTVGSVSDVRELLTSSAEGTLTNSPSLLPLSALTEAQSAVIKKAIVEELLGKDKYIYDNDVEARYDYIIGNDDDDDENEPLIDDLIDFPVSYYPMGWGFGESSCPFLCRDPRFVRVPVGEAPLSESLAPSTLFFQGQSMSNNSALSPSLSPPKRCEAPLEPFSFAYDDLPVTPAPTSPFGSAPFPTSPSEHPSVLYFPSASASLLQCASSPLAGIGYDFCEEVPVGYYPTGPRSVARCDMSGGNGDDDGDDALFAVGGSGVGYHLQQAVYGGLSSSSSSSSSYYENAFYNSYNSLANGPWYDETVIRRVPKVKGSPSSSYSSAVSDALSDAFDGPYSKHNPPLLRTVTSPLLDPRGAAKVLSYYGLTVGAPETDPSSSPSSAARISSFDVAFITGGVSTLLAQQYYEDSQSYLYGSAATTPPSASSSSLFNPTVPIASGPQSCGLMRFRKASFAMKDLFVDGGNGAVGSFGRQSVGQRLGIAEGESRRRGPRRLSPLKRAYLMQQRSTSTLMENNIKIASGAAGGLTDPFDITIPIPKAPAIRRTTFNASVWCSLYNDLVRTPAGSYGYDGLALKYNAILFANLSRPYNLSYFFGELVKSQAVAATSITGDGSTNTNTSGETSSSQSSSSPSFSFSFEQHCLSNASYTVEEVVYEDELISLEQISGDEGDGADGCFSNASSLSSSSLRAARHHPQKQDVPLRRTDEDTILSTLLLTDPYYYSDDNADNGAVSQNPEKNNTNKPPLNKNRNGFTAKFNISHIDLIKVAEALLRATTTGPAAKLKKNSSGKAVNINGTDDTVEDDAIRNLLYPSKPRWWWMRQHNDDVDDDEGTIVSNYDDSSNATENISSFDLLPTMDEIGEVLNYGSQADDIIDNSRLSDPSSSSMPRVTVEIASALIKKKKKLRSRSPLTKGTHAGQKESLSPDTTEGFLSSSDEEDAFGALPETVEELPLWSYLISFSVNTFGVEAQLMLSVIKNTSLASLHAHSRNDDEDDSTEGGSNTPADDANVEYTDYLSTPFMVLPNTLFLNQTAYAATNYREVCAGISPQSSSSASASSSSSSSPLLYGPIDIDAEDATRADKLGRIMALGERGRGVGAVRGALAKVERLKFLEALLKEQEASVANTTSPSSIENGSTGVPSASTIAAAEEEVKRIRSEYAAFIAYEEAFNASAVHNSHQIIADFSSTMASIASSSPLSDTPPLLQMQRRKKDPYLKRTVNATLLMLLDMIVLDAKERVRSAGGKTPRNSRPAPSSSSSYDDGLFGVVPAAGYEALLAETQTLPSHSDPATTTSSSSSSSKRTSIGDVWPEEDVDRFLCPCGDEEREEWWWADEGYVGQGLRTCTKTRHTLTSKYLVHLPYVMRRSMQRNAQAPAAATIPHPIGDSISSDPSFAASGQVPRPSTTSSVGLLTFADFSCGFSIDFSESLVFFEVGGRILPESCAVAPRVEYLVNFTHEYTHAFVETPLATTSTTSSTPSSLPATPSFESLFPKLIQKGAGISAPAPAAAVAVADFAHANDDEKEEGDISAEFLIQPSDVEQMRGGDAIGQRRNASSFISSASNTMNFEEASRGFSRQSSTSPSSVLVPTLRSASRINEKYQRLSPPRTIPFFSSPTYASIFTYFPKNNSVSQTSTSGYSLSCPTRAYYVDNYSPEPVYLTLLDLLPSPRKSAADDDDFDDGIAEVEGRRAADDEDVDTVSFGLSGSVCSVWRRRLIDEGHVKNSDEGRVKMDLDDYELIVGKRDPSSSSSSSLSSVRQPVAESDYFNNVELRRRQANEEEKASIFWGRGTLFSGNTPPTQRAAAGVVAASEGLGELGSRAPIQSSIPIDVIPMAGQRFVSPVPLFSTSPSSTFFSLAGGVVINDDNKVLSSREGGGGSEGEGGNTTFIVSQSLKRRRMIRDVVSSLRLSVGGWTGDSRAGMPLLSSSKSGSSTVSPSVSSSSRIDLAETPHIHLKLAAGNGAATTSSSYSSSTFHASYSNGTKEYYQHDLGVDKIGSIDSSVDNTATTVAEHMRRLPATLPTLYGRTLNEYFNAVTASINVAAATVSFISFLPQTSKAVRAHIRREMSLRVMTKKLREVEPTSFASATLERLKTSSRVIYSDAYNTSLRIQSNRTAPPSSSSSPLLDGQYRISYIVQSSSSEIFIRARSILSSNGFSERLNYNSRRGFSAAGRGGGGGERRLRGDIDGAELLTSPVTTPLFAQNTIEYSNGTVRGMLSFPVSSSSSSVGGSLTEARADKVVRELSYPFLDTLRNEQTTSIATTPAAQNTIGLRSSDQTLVWQLEPLQCLNGFYGYPHCSSVCPLASLNSTGRLNTDPNSIYYYSPATTFESPMTACTCISSRVMVATVKNVTTFDGWGRPTTSYNKPFFTCERAAASYGPSIVEHVEVSAVSSRTTFVTEMITTTPPQTSTTAPSSIVVGKEGESAAMMAVGEKRAAIETTSNAMVMTAATIRTDSLPTAQQQQQASQKLTPSTEATQTTTRLAVKPSVGLANVPASVARRLPIVPPTFRLKVPLSSIPANAEKTVTSYSSSSTSVTSSAAEGGGEEEVVETLNRTDVTGRISARLFCGGVVPAAASTSLSMTSSVSERFEMLSTRSLSSTSASTSPSLSSSSSSSSRMAFYSDADAEGGVIIMGRSNATTNADDGGDTEASTTRLSFHEEERVATGGASVGASDGGEWTFNNLLSFGWGTKLAGAFSSAQSLSTTILSHDDSVVLKRVNPRSKLSDYFELDTQKPSPPPSNIAMNGTAAIGGGGGRRDSILSPPSPFSSFSTIGDVVSNVMSLGSSSSISSSQQPLIDWSTPTVPDVIIQPQPVASFYGEWCTVGARVLDPPLRKPGPMTYSHSFLSLVRAATPNPTASSIFFSMRNFTILRNLQGRIPLYAQQKKGSFESLRTTSPVATTTDSTSLNPPIRSTPQPTTVYDWFLPTTSVEVTHPTTLAPPTTPTTTVPTTTTTTTTSPPTTTDPFIYVPPTIPPPVAPTTTVHKTTVVVQTTMTITTATGASGEPSSDQPAATPSRAPPTSATNAITTTTTLASTAGTTASQATSFTATSAPATTAPPTTIATTSSPSSSSAATGPTIPLSRTRGYSDINYYFRLSNYQLAETFTLSPYARHTEARKALLRLSKAMRDVKVHVVVVASYLYPRGDPAEFSRLYSEEAHAKRSQRQDSKQLHQKDHTVDATVSSPSSARSFGASSSSALSSSFKFDDKSDPNGFDVDFISEEIIQPSSVAERSSGIAGQLGKMSALVQTLQEEDGGSPNANVGAPFAGQSQQKHHISLNHGEQNHYYSGDEDSHFIDTDDVDILTGGRFSSSSSPPPSTLPLPQQQALQHDQRQRSTQGLVISLKIPQKFLSEELSESVNPFASLDGVLGQNNGGGGAVAAEAPPSPLSSPPASSSSDKSSDYYTLPPSASFSTASAEPSSSVNKNPNGLNINKDGTAVSHGTPPKPLWVFVRIIPSVLRSDETANDLQVARNGLNDNTLFTSSAFSPSGWTAVTLLPFSTLPPPIRALVEALDPDLGTTSAASDILSSALLGDPFAPFTGGEETTQPPASSLSSATSIASAASAAGSSGQTSVNGALSNNVANAYVNTFMSPSASLRNPSAVQSLNTALLDTLLSSTSPLSPLPRTGKGRIISIVLLAAGAFFIIVCCVCLVYMSLHRGRLPLVGYLFCEGDLNRAYRDAKAAAGDSEGEKGVGGNQGDRGENGGAADAAGVDEDDSHSHGVDDDDDEGDVSGGIMVEIVTPYGPQQVFIPKSMLNNGGIVNGDNNEKKRNSTATNSTEDAATKRRQSFAEAPPTKTKRKRKDGNSDTTIVTCGEPNDTVYSAGSQSMRSEVDPFATPRKNSNSNPTNRRKSSVTISTPLPTRKSSQSDATAKAPPVATVNRETQKRRRSSAQLQPSSSSFPPKQHVMPSTFGDKTVDVPPKTRRASELFLSSTSPPPAARQVPQRQRRASSASPTPPTSVSINAADTLTPPPSSTRRDSSSLGYHQNVFSNPFVSASTSFVQHQQMLQKEEASLAAAAAARGRRSESGGRHDTPTPAAAAAATTVRRKSSITFTSDTVLPNPAANQVLESGRRRQSSSAASATPLSFLKPQKRLSIVHDVDG